MNKDNKMRLMWAAVVVVVLIFIVWLMKSPTASAPGAPEVTIPISLTGAPPTPSQPTVSIPAPKPGTPTIPVYGAFDGKNYRIASYNNQVLPGSENYTVAFTDGKLVAHVCNTISGNYSAVNGLFTTKLYTTHASCTLPEDTAKVEQIIGTVLSQAATYTTDGRNLILSGSGSTLILTLN